MPWTAIALMIATLPLVLAAQPLAGADPLVVVGGYDPAVRTFSLSPDGSLHPLATVAVGRNPSFLAITADARTLYACDEVAPGRVVACALDRSDGSIRVLGSASSGGDGPCFIAIHPSGAWLFAANYGDGSVAVLPLGGEARLGALVARIVAGGNAHMALPSADGRFVQVPCKGADRIVTYQFDAATGALAPVATTPTPTGSGPRHLALGQDGRAWLVDELSSAVQPAQVAADGSLSLGAPVPTLPAGWSGRNTAGGILLTDEGRLLLVSNRGHDSLAAFAPDAEGVPQPIGTVAVGRTPRHLAASPDGRFILVACQGADRVEVLRRDGARLTAVGGVSVPRPAFVGTVP